MKIKLIFDDWRENAKSIYHNKQGYRLTSGQFHSGTTFSGRIDLDAWDEKELREALEKGYQPVFWISI